MEDNTPKITPKPAVPWYYRTGVIVVAILAVGPLALPLVWLAPQFRLWVKWAITLALIVLTVATIIASQRLYTMLSTDLETLTQTLR